MTKNLQITVADARRIVGGDVPLAAEMVPYFNQMAPFFEVNTIDRMSELLGQIAVESAFRYRKELWGPTKQQLRYDPASKTKLSADLGNIKIGDGAFFKGHGGIQVTGRANTVAFRDWCRKKMPGLNVPDFEVEPHRIGEGVWWVLAIFWYWDTRNLNALADKRQTTAITRKINGGTTHLADRKAAVDRARAILTARYGMGEVAEVEGSALIPTPGAKLPGSIFPEFDVGAAPGRSSGPLDGLGGLIGSIFAGGGAAAPSMSEPAMVDVRRGVVSEPLRRVQRLLFDLGYKGVGEADGKWGPDTRDAGLAFRRDNRLPAPADLNGDGVLSASEVMDAEFMSALLTATGRSPNPDRLATRTKDIASMVPEVARARLSKIIAGTMFGGATVPGIGGFLWDQVQGLPELRLKLDPIFQAFSLDLKPYQWMLILAVGMGATWWFSRGSEKAGVEAYRVGERLAQK